MGQGFEFCTSVCLSFSLAAVCLCMCSSSSTLGDDTGGQYIYTCRHKRYVVSYPGNSGIDREFAWLKTVGRIYEGQPQRTLAYMEAFHVSEHAARKRLKSGTCCRAARVRAGRRHITDCTIIAEDDMNVDNNVLSGQ